MTHSHRALLCCILFSVLLTLPIRNCYKIVILAHFISSHLYTVTVNMSENEFMSDFSLMRF